MIKGHKCSPLCRPWEYVHCLPDRWDHGKNINDWRRALNETTVADQFEVVDVRPESDATSMYLVGLCGETIPPGSTVGGRCGYLTWLKDLDDEKNGRDWPYEEDDDG